MGESLMRHPVTVPVELDVESRLEINYLLSG